MKSLQILTFLPMKIPFVSFMFLLATDSFANNPGISYQGRIFKPDGNPLEGTTVQFRMQVRSPGSENCLLYEEVQTLNMAGSAGVFALTLNDGTGTRLDTATYQVDRIFANRDTMTLDTTRCASGTTYTPNSSDGRKLVVYFKDETMAAYEAMPLMNLNYVPQAMYALEAQKVDKFAVSNILRAVDGSGNPVAAPALNPTQLVNLNTLLATPAANYVQTTTNGSAALPVVAGNPSSGLAAGQIWYDSGSNVMKYYDGAVKTFGTSGGGVTSVATGTGLTGGPITTTGTINVDVGVTTGQIVQVAASNKLPVIDGSNLTNITATDATKLPLAGGTMTGPLVNNSNSASTALAVTQAGTGYAASFMGGNVAVGTASPTRLFDVRGPGTMSAGSHWLAKIDSANSGVLDFGYLSDGTNVTAMRIKAGGSIPLHLGTTSNIHQLVILDTGNVGIGTTGPSSKFHVLGSSAATIATFADGGATTCTVTPASTGFACSSDERLKKNIETFSDSASLENILQLRTVTYDWRSVDNGRHTGYIAQELEKVVPELVRTGEDGFKQVNYTGLVPWITGAIKAFYAEFKTSDEIKSREIASVKAENAELKARLDQQEKELAAIKKSLGL
jgi:hypothetical protein